MGYDVGNNYALNGNGEGLLISTVILYGSIKLCVIRDPMREYFVFWVFLWTKITCILSVFLTFTNNSILSELKSSTPNFDDYGSPWLN